ncbi:tRNA (adenosine(37)-N6)-threonylcarbamoyltransferase complex ATPase subunit type 1 TsaE [Petroclostridium sp. X23]|uniref:tRNA (adenosine(37)-N6)-threonylcarbamoyltransferase complex ATPase subunit type 1 TsaE n=1 Tax=Petroclostridium sp. X23 TaxID=3045146 RepID=UPI0024ADA1C4|nr:tRNA (adenosine(37)-N6)-threonylcarbamoyltransferase complex ATPase subunit type 1 TsaE [Petroclostridium sp. X23]WHH57563.1 tRNA (adenosine(37)-N6)-threonylcarbamoyltransferase complex ATPase subunit type 1 TsaE [Petroclostridium sp. X23]
MSSNGVVLKSNSPEETAHIAYRLGQALKPGDVLCLGGDLGAGKTAFTKGLVKAFGVREDVTSPTFTIVNEYEGTIPIYHFDVYRIHDADEMFEIGFEEYIYGEGISIIEWAENIKDLLPPSYFQISINKDLEKGENYREIVIESIGNIYKDMKVENKELKIVR